MTDHQHLETINKIETKNIMNYQMLSLKTKQAL